MSNDKVPLAAVLGHPVGHSRSPVLHGHWLRRYEIAGHYIPIDIAPDDFETKLRQLPGLGFVGCNVTIPHKESALALADTATDRARQIGAANTLTFTDSGEIHADNTDSYGFIANLTAGAPGWLPSEGPAVVLGAGGAARGVLYALLDAGVQAIALSNRTLSRAEALAQDFGPKVRVVNWADLPAALMGANLLVNTTSLGMTGMDPLTLNLDNLPKSATVTDIVYTPLDTPLLITARTRGCATVDGLGMLLHQAVPGFEAWFGRRPDVDGDLRQAVLGA